MSQQWLKKKIRSGMEQVNAKMKAKPSQKMMTKQKKDEKKLMMVKSVLTKMMNPPRSSPPRPESACSPTSPHHE